MEQVDAKHDIVDGHAGPTVQAYVVIFLVLCVCTAISFAVNAIFGIGSHSGMAIIMAVAVCKATLVCMFFMHLKYEWMKLYFLIVPVAILGVMMMIVLLPDIVFGGSHEPMPESARTAGK
jgi:caa(3)-type oxidase subunit IV